MGGPVPIGAVRALRIGLTAFATILASGVSGGAARAEAAPLCALGDGPVEYQSRLSPLLSPPMSLPPAPPAPPVRSAAYPSVGAGALARDALGGQFTMYWLNSVVQGWVVGVAPGPLSLEQARARIVDALAPHFTPADLAYLSERLHIDPQPYSEAELRATQAQVGADLWAIGAFWSGGYGACRLSDAIRVEVTLYNGADQQLVERVRAVLARYGDRVRLEVVPHGPPSPGALLPAPAPAATPTPVPVERYVSLPNAKRCVRRGLVRIAVRRGRSAVRSLSVKANGRRRTISGTRLRKPLEVRLTRAQTRIEITVRLRGGRSGTKTVTFKRCR